LRRRSLTIAWRMGACGLWSRKVVCRCRQACLCRSSMMENICFLIAEADIKKKSGLMACRSSDRVFCQPASAMIAETGKRLFMRHECRQREKTTQLKFFLDN